MHHPMNILTNTELHALMGEFMVCEVFPCKVVWEKKTQERLFVNNSKMFLLQLADKAVEINICLSSNSRSKTIK